MTQELCDKLIAWYEESIGMVEQIPADDMYKIRKLLNARSVHSGICACASFEFDESIYSDEWVRQNKTEGSDMWYKALYMADHKEEVIELLQKRVDRLKTFSESTQPAI